MDSLFSSFPETSLEEWKEKLKKDLKGLSFEDLSSLDNNNLKIPPFFNQENTKSASCQVFQNPDWAICTKINVEESKIANAEALKALNNGASGLIFIIENKVQYDLDNLLKDIGIQYIYLSFKFQNPNFTAELKTYLKQQKLTLADLNCHLNYDPISNALLRENSIKESDYIQFVEASNGAVNISIDSAIFQNAGANSLTQLASGLAQLNEYVHILNKNGRLENVLKVNFNLAIGTGFFEEIAKMRALRILISNLCKVYEITADLTVSAETSGLYNAQLDVQNNILRNSVAGMAAVLGGCDNLSIQDYDVNHSSSDFSRRIAINQQLIFKEESYFNKVADIAGGAYYLETYTYELVEKAWSLFQEIEKQGGLFSFARDGSLAKTLEQQAKHLVEQYQSGEKSLIGVNKFVNKTNEDNVAPIEQQSDDGIQVINLSKILLS